MLPYVELPPIKLTEGLELHAYGLLIVTAVLVGAGYYASLVHRHLSLQPAIDAVGWAVPAGFLGAHVFNLIASDPERLVDEGPAELLNLGTGLSSFGGIFVGFFVLWLVLRRRVPNPLAYLDAAVESFAVAWVFGRLGCSLAHDHPGHLTTFPLAVTYPDGARHDLGLYELVVTAAILLPLLVWMRRRLGPPGRVFATAALTYAPIRFALDFLRATDLPNVDPRYAGLTPSQWSCVLLLAFGIGLARRIARQRHES